MKRDIDWGLYPALSNDIHWGVVKARYVCDDELDEGLVSNVTILPFAGERCVIFQVADGSWELPGGTLELGEGYMDALRREVREELGAELESFRLIGQFHCESSAPGPFRPHIPHPRFIRAVGYGEVRLAFDPLNPEGAEQVIAVETVELDEAVRRFVQNGRDDIADLYRLAYACRKRDREEAD